MQQGGLLDRSGVRLYCSEEKRANVAGLMLLGDYMLKLRGLYTVVSENGNGISGSGRNAITIVNGATTAGMRHSFLLSDILLLHR